MRPKGNVLSLSVLTGILFFWSPTISKADLVVFTNQAAWSSASSGATTITFAGLGGDRNDADQAYPYGLTIDGVRFASDPASLHYLDVRSESSENFMYGPPYGTVCWGNCYSWPANAGIQVTLPPGTTSVGWYFANFLQSGLPGISYADGLTVTFVGGTTYSNDYTGSVFPGIGESQFVGFVSDSPITSFEIQGPGYPTVEDFSFGEAAIMPEPKYEAISGLLFAFICVAARRHRWLPCRGHNKLSFGGSGISMNA